MRKRKLLVRKKHIIPEPEVYFRLRSVFLKL